MTRLPSLILSATLLTVLPSSQPEVQTCAVQVVIDLQTYDGPKHYENFCLSLPAMYGDGLLSIEAVGIGDKLFHGDFELWP
jgi:hypothetical protein